jgi:hypothetical protein
MESVLNCEYVIEKMQRISKEYPKELEVAKLKWGEIGTRETSATFTSPLTLGHFGCLLSILLNNF